MFMTEINNYDVVVVGTGNAALSAAVSASEQGSKVLMLEKGPDNKRGGNSFFTDGAIRFAYDNVEGIRRLSIHCLTTKLLILKCLYMITMIFMMTL